MKTHWVMDYETLSNCFIAVFEDIKSDDREIFVVHESRNDTEELVNFLNRNKTFNEWHVSFNGLGFDSQITEYILRKQNDLCSMSAQDVAAYLYSKAQQIINSRYNIFYIVCRWIKCSLKEFNLSKVD